LFPEAPWAEEARSALRHNLTESNLARESEYLRAPGREGFERPYGLAWLLQLAAELRELDDPDARNWLMWIKPLETIAIERLVLWLRRLGHPIRSGEHSQTAFAMGLAIDWARIAHDEDSTRVLIARSHDFHELDRDAPLSYEPSGHDFLSPALAAADLMRRVMQPDLFASWLGMFLPSIPTDGSEEWIKPVRCPDPSDGKLSHLDGLNLSRAWMLEDVASALSESDPRWPALLTCAKRHTDAGLGAISGAHYAGAHRLGSFAVYLLTRRGLR
jgi:hypothetical protein